MRESRSPRILILHASVGSGHTRAAQAVEAALREICPATYIRSVDVLALTSTVFRKVYGDGYLGLAGSAPHLLGYLYDMSDRPENSRSFGDSIRCFVENWSLRALRRSLREEAWDIILCTHFLPAQVIAYLRRRDSLRIPQATVITDFDAHRFWATLPCEHFFAATEEGASSLRYWGVPGENISVTGIPIHPNFSRLSRREACLKAHGLPGDRPILLQLAGGFGTGPVEEVYRSLIQMEIPVEIVVVTGRNAEIRRQLSSISIPSRHRAHILGYTDKMHELMAAADVVISKPGGLTTSEALACGVPMVIVNPIPGQESRNCDYLLENGAALKVNGVGGARDKLTSILRQPGRLAQMRERARSLGRPESAFAVARKVLEMVDERCWKVADFRQTLNPRRIHPAATTESPFKSRRQTARRSHRRVPSSPKIRAARNDAEIPA